MLVTTGGLYQNIDGYQEAVGHAVVVLLQLYRNGGKLGLAFGIQAVGIGGQFHPLIPRGFNKSPEQIGIAAAAHGGFDIRQG